MPGERLRESGGAALSAPEGSGAIEGRLDAIVDGRAIGWAWRPGDDLHRVAVVVLVDGSPVAEAVADGPRPSLAEAGKGDGAHGFAVELPRSLADGGAHTVRAVAGPEQIPLPAALRFSVDAGEQSPFAGTEFQPGDRQDDVRPAPVRAPLALALRERVAPRARAIAGASLAREKLPALVLGGGCAFYFLLFAYLTRHHGFFQDEWELLISRRAWNADSFFQPHVQSLLALPILVYKVLFVTVGVGHTWPYRLPGFLLHDVCVVGLYVLARRRAGAWLALIPAGLLLILGAGWEDELWAMQMTFLASIAAGIWALILLEREDRRGEVAATALVTIAVVSSSVGLPFAATIGAMLLVYSRRRLWVAVVPLLIYLLWYSQYGVSDVPSGNLAHVPGYVVRIASYAFAGLLGLSSNTSGTGGTIAYLGFATLVVSVAALVLTVVRTRRVPPLAVAGVAGALALWIATAMARAQYHQPDSSQYVYPSAVFILLTLIAFMRWRPIRLPVAAGLAVAGLVIAIVGSGPLRQYAGDRVGVDSLVRTEFGAAQLAGLVGDPAYVPDPRHLSYVTYGDYMGLVRDLGSPAFTPQQIAQQPVGDQLAADRVLLGVEHIVPGPAPGHGGASCTSARELAVAPGHTIYARAPAGQAIGLAMRRLSPSFPTPPQFTVAAGRAVSVAFPRDASALPWHVLVSIAGSSGAPVCVAVS